MRSNGCRNRSPVSDPYPLQYQFSNREPLPELANLAVSPAELAYLRDKCPFLSSTYLDFLQTFRFRPSEHVDLRFDTSETDRNDCPDLGDVRMTVSGLWIDTILYEIPLLALTSEAFFRFCDTDWDYGGQEEAAHRKGRELLESGIVFSEFGTRRRRDYKTQDLVMKGLVKGREEAGKAASGKFTGTSNVHFAMRYGVNPVGTVAHEWFMGIAAATDDYETASEKALEYWIGCFGEGVLGIALTDTFGTPAFLRAFSKPAVNGSSRHSYAEVFSGVRQDSGNPEDFIKLMRGYYDKIGIKDKTIVFSDSLTVDRCRKYRDLAEGYGFTASFGIGTHLTSKHSQADFGCILIEASR